MGVPSKSAVEFNSHLVACSVYKYGAWGLLQKWSDSRLNPAPYESKGVYLFAINVMQNGRVGGLEHHILGHRRNIMVAFVQRLQNTRCGKRQRGQFLDGVSKRR